MVIFLHQNQKKFILYQIFNYMKYIAYCRKSTDTEDRQVLSIDSQVSEMKKLASRDNIFFDEVFTEKMSAKSPGRPIFAEMLKYIEKNKECVVYSWKLDRLARNAKDGGELSWFMDRKLIKEIRTFEKNIGNTSDDKFMMSLDFGMAKKYVDDLSVNVKRGLRAKLEKGEYPGPAPLGYLNDKVIKKIVIDPVNSKYVAKIFRLYVTGGHSTRDIEKIMYSDGFRTAKGGKVYKSVINRILLNHIYYGLIISDGKAYKGIHEPIVSKDIFDKVQSLLNQGSQPRKKIHSFPYRGFMRCDNCGCILTASLKKGHTYYYCTNGKGNCEQHKKYLRSEKIDKMFLEILDSVTFDEEIIEMAYQANLEKKNLDVEYLETVRLNLHERLKNNRQKQEKLLDGYLSELVDEDVYKSKTEALNVDKKGIEQDLERLESQQAGSTLELVKEAFLLPGKAKKIILNSDDDKKREQIETLLWNFLIKDKKMASVSLKEPYSIMKKSPKKDDFSDVLDGWGSNPRPTGYSFLFLSKKTGLFHHPCINLIWSRAFRVRSASNPFYESYSHKGIVSEPSQFSEAFV